MIVRVARRVTAAALLTGLALASTTAAGAATNGFPDPVTSQGQDTLDLWVPFSWLAVGIGLLVYVLMAIIVIRFRRRGRDEVPSQQQYASGIELVYTVLPVLIVAVMFWFGWQTEDEVTDLSAEPDVTVDVIGFQWQWQFLYEGQDPSDAVLIQGTPEEPPTLVLPTDSTVRLRLEANDVIHSFWVPEFLQKRDLIPEIDNEIQIEITEEGTWQGRCAEYCGLNHWQMYFQVRAVSPDEFQQWLDDQPRTSATTTTSTGSGG